MLLEEEVLQKLLSSEGEFLAVVWFEFKKYRNLIKLEVKKIK